MDVILSFGALLKQARRFAGMTQAALAEQAGFSTNYISQLERGLHAPPAATVELLARALALDAVQAATLAAAARDGLRAPASTQDIRAVPLASGSSPSLPHMPDLIGRAAFLANLKQRLTEQHDLALYGLPGVGKSTLALALAHDPAVRAWFPDGVLWARLGQTPALEMQLIGWGMQLGMVPESLTRWNDITALCRMLHAFIAGQRLLLIIDDAWKIADALAFRVGGDQCVHILTTRFAPIAFQFARAGAIPVAELDNASSLELLQHLAPRAVALEPHVAASLAQATGGLPLALALMGNYLQSQSLCSQPRRMHMALERLRDATARLQLSEPLAISDLLAGQAPDTERSLQAAIALSDHALSEKLRAILRDLAIFPSKPASFSETTAQAVCALPADEIGPALDALTDAALIESVTADRYQIHQTIVDYARLAGPNRLAQERLVRYFSTCVGKPHVTRDMFDREWELLREALILAGHLEMHQELIALVSALAPVMINRGLYDAADAALRQARAVDCATKDRVHILHYTGLLALKRGKPGTALTLLSEALALTQTDASLRICRSAILATLGMVYHKSGDYAQAEQAAQEGIALAREFGDDASLGALLHLSGVLCQKRGLYAVARAAWQESVTIAMQSEDSELLVALLGNLGMVARKEGDSVQAERYYQEALALARQIGYRERLSTILRQLGVIAFERGATDEAREFYEEALREARAIGFEEGIQHALISLGAFAAQQEDFQQAQAYMIEGLAIARALGQRDAICIFLTNLGMMAIDMGDYALAERYLSEGIAIAHALQSQERISGMLEALGEAALARGALAEAEAHAAEALALAQKINHHEKIAQAFFLLGRVFARQGDGERAKGALQESLTRLQAMNNMRIASAAACELGEVYMAEGEWEQARRLFEMALADSTLLHYRGYDERARQNLAECERHTSM